jgi:hypothetical protein
VRVRGRRDVGQPASYRRRHSSAAERAFHTEAWANRRLDDDASPVRLAARTPGTQPARFGAQQTGELPGVYLQRQEALSGMINEYKPAA